MRTDESRPRGLASGSLRGGADRARRWISDLGVRARVGLAAGALILVIAAGYLATADTATTDTAWLFEGHALSPEESDRILSALAIAKIPASTAARGQIAVPIGRKADALTLLVKQKLGPKTLADLREDSASESLFAWPGGRDRRREQFDERAAERMIADMRDGIESADVRIRRAARPPGSRTAKVAALVRVTMSDGRRLTTRNIQAIRAFLKGNEPDLTPEAITILDKTGWTYSDAGDPRAATETMARVRENEIEAAIKQKLDWIDGARVSVTLEKPRPAEPAPVAGPPPSPSIVMNGPADASDAAPPQPAPPRADEALGKAMILVQVPISHYLRAYRTLHRREASLDDLKPFAAKVDQTIRKAIDFVVPPSEVASVPTIDRIDDAGPAPPPTSPVESESGPARTWWLPAGAALAVATITAAATASRMLTARRPTVTTSAVPRANFEVHDDSGPSGRVRELIRRDPAAAAGVLHRWIGQGGPSS